MSIKVAIADDHHLFRHGLINLLSESNEIEVVAQAENGEMAVDICLEHKPDIILMDIGMPIMNGIQATELLKSKHSTTKVIALSMHSEKNIIKEILEKGALGYLMKSCTYTQLVDAIKIVYDGNKYLDEYVTSVILNDYLGPKENESLHNNLSKRELEILILFAEGYSSKAIAEKIFVSIKTVCTHKQNILYKLNLNSTTDIVKYAIRNKLINLNQ
jgi:DNA-binding NarL/FixJ family response regulator